MAANYIVEEMFTFNYEIMVCGKYARMFNDITFAASYSLSKWFSPKTYMHFKQGLTCI